MEQETYREALRPLFAGRKVVCIGATAVGLSSIATTARELGATDVLIVSLAGYGVGVPVEVAEVYEASITAVATSPAVTTSTTVTTSTAVTTSTTMETLRREEEFKQAPSAELLAVLHRFDPDREAVVLGQFVNTVSHLDGRPFLSYRRAEWMRLEDKTVIDAFWDRSGVSRAESVTCLAQRKALTEASLQIDAGAGVVWSGDSREGFNGGAEYVYIVRNQLEFDTALTFFGRHCDQVRVMPYLRGVPCSIHGVVFPDYVAVVRPIEMVVLQRTAPQLGEGVFAYRGCASFYDPSESVRVQMISAAKLVGDQLRSEVGFRGCFTIDGVASPTGFLPTELNPRLGAGLNAVFAAAPDIPFSLIIDALVSGAELDIDPALFETRLRGLADSRRAGGSWGQASSGVAENQNRPAVFDGKSWRWAVEGEDPWGKVSSGSRGDGGFARVTFQPEMIPAGPSVAPLAAAFWAFATNELGAEVGPMVPAEDCVP
jgi:hypothetical protein